MQLARIKMRVIIVACLLCCFATAQPSFPGDSAGLVKDMASDTKDIEMDNAEEENVLDTLKKHAKAVLGSDLLASEMEFGLRQAAYVAARVRLLKQIYVGGCPRNMTTPCPVGWGIRESDSTCKPPKIYDGRCGDISFTSLTALEKETLAWKCRASWPCASPCKKDFSKCPLGWKMVGRICVAPDEYDGICSPATDFKSYSVEEKSRWSVMCTAPWPCENDQETAGKLELHYNGPLSKRTIESLA